MGQLKNINLEDYRCDFYVETGTGEGGTLSKAIHSSIFEKCYSVDMDLIQVIKARTNFPGSLIENSLSTVAIEKWVKTELPLESSVLFFLDAHFPGSDYHGRPYNVSDDHAVPLKEELELIKQYRPNNKDIIICDDARIYTSGPFENGDVSSWLNVPGGYQFIYDIFPEDKITVSYDEDGYFIIDRR